jgi:phage-related minor tail protein
MPNSIQSATAEIAASGEQLKRSLTDMGSLGDQFASRLINSFEQVAVRGKKLEDVVKSLGQSLAQLALKAALKPLEGALGGIFNQILNGLGGAMTGGGAGGGMSVPFARGGVISSPINFPLSDGRAAIAGEQGAEAILPLTRGSDGQLGVRSSGGGGGANITFNISTPDVAGFQRSQTQIAALLQRGLSAGQRNL